MLFCLRVLKVLRVSWIRFCREILSFDYNLGFKYLNSVELAVITKNYPKLLFRKIY